MTQIITFLSDPGVWAWVSIGIITIVIVGEFIAKMFPYDRHR